MPTVSVVIPAYNAEATLREALDSVLAFLDADDTWLPQYLAEGRRLAPPVLVSGTGNAGGWQDGGSEAVRADEPAAPALERRIRDRSPGLEAEPRSDPVARPDPGEISVNGSSEFVRLSEDTRGRTVHDGGGEPMQVLVTGGAGFVGGHMVRALLRTSPQVRVTSLDVRQPPDPDGLDPRRYRFVRVDVADRWAVDALFAEGFDAVVHCAALTPTVGDRWDGPALVHTNVVGTQVLLEATLRRGVRRFVQVSTDEVYGPAPPGVGFSEESPPNPQSPYAASRAAADLLCLGYRRMYGLSTVVVRIPSVYGPAEPIERFVPLVITRALRGSPIPICGDGRQERDWLYVEDLVEALLRVLFHPDPRPVLNVATGKTASYLAVARTVLQIVGRPTSLLEFVTDRSVECRRSALDPSRARAYLGWRPTVNLEEGLERTVAWYEAHRAWWEVCTDGERRIRAARG